ncbi:MAG: DUF4105 domain-containing protein [Myxococcales bacterium]|nr:DUF4105 domain-containing protein [Myxococcales bacterium]
MRKLLALVFCALLVALAPGGTSSAQPEGSPPVSGSDPPPDAPERPAPSDPGSGDAGGGTGATAVKDRLRVSVLTFSPGDHPFYKFGHNAIVIYDDTKRGRRDYAKVYNYGTFSFGDPALIPKFFLGRFMYWLSAQTLQGTILGYKRENRAITEQVLDLDAETKIELQRALEENLQGDNKYYKYDYYRDNCSTRVRDMIDRVTKGRVKAAAAGPARLTYRQHTLRLTESLPAEYVILNLVMGDLIDKPVTEWDEDFIPMEFQKTLRKVTVVGPDGTERPIVKEEKVILPSQQVPPPDNPPIWWPYALATGLVMGGALAGLGRAAAKGRGARIAIGALLSLFGLVFGFFGWFFLAAWAFTDHAVGYGNENVMLCVPWAIVLTGTGINVARGKARSITRALLLVKAAAVSAVVALVVKALPWFDQDNGFFLVFFIPFWAGAFVGLRLLARSAEDVRAPEPKKPAAKKKAEERADAAAAKPKSGEAAKPAVKDEEDVEG